MRNLGMGACLLGFFALGGAAALTLPSCIDSLETFGDASLDAGPNTGFYFRGGETCTEPDPRAMTAIFQPNIVFLTPCAQEPCPARETRVVVDPDYCRLDPETGSVLPDERAPVRFSTSSEAIAKRPGNGEVGFHLPTVPLQIKAGARTGTATITAAVTVKEGAPPVEGRLQVEVLEAKLPPCGGRAETPLLDAGETLRGEGKLAGATLGLPKGADKPNSQGFRWHTDPFAASIECASDIRPQGSIALGPAIKFGPAKLAFQREVTLSIPINPALMPHKARLRHLRVAYSGPAFREPRTIPVADPRIEKVDGQWALTFKAPRLGTYQAVVAGDAGTKSFKRRLTHRAVIGISMGGGGTATFGMRHHDLFDVMAPLGGPVHWTWLIDYIEKNHLGGFRPIPKGTTLADIQLTPTPCSDASACKPDEQCLGVIDSPPTPGKCVFLPTSTEPYLHTQTFNNWWYEFPSSGNGGSFDRENYVQIFRDLAIMHGNPNGENLAKGGGNLPAGVPLNHKSVLGEHPGQECRVWLDPIDTDPDYEKQKEIAATCPAERCANTLTLQNYFDDEFNPDGTFPVITVCDGAPQNELFSPWANQWQPTGNVFPLEVGLAVDYNGNGVRDELEPIIRAGHETWYDFGNDGVASPNEPGYQAGVNEDPAGDDYEAQYNPNGTENDHRRQSGEDFDDFGLDGVKGTKQQPLDGWKLPGDGYDVGEGDGRFTVASGLQRFWDHDSHSILHGLTEPSKIPAGPLSDAALQRIDIWTDGGTRDLFNFAVAARHLVGGFHARGREVSYITGFTQPPGLDPKDPDAYRPSRVVYEDLQGVVFQRYGNPDPSPQDVEGGSGKHVGTANEVLQRLQSALYFIGSRWQEPELRILAHRSGDAPAPHAPTCEVAGNCKIDFTSKSGRTGPVGITLPPGYAHKDLQGIRYPVIYFLHGYGQAPQDLLAAQALFVNWMNSPLEGMASRLPKAIIVYVDGRCRKGPSGKAECVRGTFYTDSPNEDSAQTEQWWLELMDYVDANYRTLGESFVDWAE
jgi:hypothetical protein